MTAREDREDARQTVQADAVETVKVNLEAALLAEADRRRHAENERLAWRIFAVLLLVLNVVGIAYFHAYIHEGRKVSANTNHLVVEIDKALSPQSKADSDKALQVLVDNLVTQINNGDIQLCTRVVGALETNKILPPGTINSCSSPSP